MTIAQGKGFMHIRREWCHLSWRSFAYPHEWPQVVVGGILCLMSPISVIEKLAISYSGFLNYNCRFKILFWKRCHQPSEASSNRDFSHLPIWALTELARIVVTRLRCVSHRSTREVKGWPRGKRGRCSTSWPTVWSLGNCNTLLVFFSPPPFS